MTPIPPLPPDEPVPPFPDPEPVPPVPEPEPVLMTEPTSPTAADHQYFVAVCNND